MTLAFLNIDWQTLADRSHVLANGALRLELGPGDAADTERLIAAYMA